MSHFIYDQPPPKSNSTVSIWDLVIKDMKERDKIGRERYGTPLQANNGRDAIADAYCEALDLVVYLRQAIVERGEESDMLDLVLFEYTNHKGEDTTRVVRPIRLWFGSTAWHTNAQYLLEAFDLVKLGTRDFAMCNIRGWRQATEEDIQFLVTEKKEK